MTRVLVVDDEPQIVRALSISLRARKYDVVVAATGRQALAAAARAAPDLVLLDLGLPDLDGVDVIRGLRAWSRVPIIILSGRHQGATKVDALDAGADDYVTKPFNIDELLARIRAVTRRSPADTDDVRVVIGDFLVDLRSPDTAAVAAFASAGCADFSSSSFSDPKSPSPSPSSGESLATVRLCRFLLDLNGFAVVVSETSRSGTRSHSISSWSSSANTHLSRNSAYRSLAVRPLLSRMVTSAPCSASTFAMRRPKKPRHTAM